MKAKHIRKLRKKLQSYKTYRVTTSTGMFGDFWLLDDESFRNIKAASQVHAILRYMNWHFRHYKQRSRHHKSSYSETSHNWGEVLVIDPKGYKRYYH